MARHKDSFHLDICKTKEQNCFIFIDNASFFNSFEDGVSTSSVWSVLMKAGHWHNPQEVRKRKRRQRKVETDLPCCEVWAALDEPGVMSPTQPESREQNKCKCWASSPADGKEFAIKRLKMLTLPWEVGNHCSEPVLQVTSGKKKKEKTFLRGQRAKMSLYKFFRARAFEYAFSKWAGWCLPQISFVLFKQGNALRDEEGLGTG